MKTESFGCTRWKGVQRQAASVECPKIAIRDQVGVATFLCHCEDPDSSGDEAILNVYVVRLLRAVYPEQDSAVAEPVLTARLFAFGSE